MDYEKNLSTQQDEKKEEVWLSSPNEDPIGAKGDQPTPQGGAEAPCRLNFPKGSRLLKRSDFFKVAKEGKRLVGRYLCLDYRPAKKGRLGISAPTRYGSSPERNRFKRLVREAYRQTYPRLPDFELNVIPRQCAKGANINQIRDEIVSLLQCN